MPEGDWAGLDPRPINTGAAGLFVVRPELPRPLPRGMFPTAKIGFGKASPPKGSLIGGPAVLGVVGSFPVFNDSGRLLSRAPGSGGAGATGSETGAGRSAGDGLTTGGRTASGVGATAGVAEAAGPVFGELFWGSGLFAGGAAFSGVGCGEGWAAGTGLDADVKAGGGSELAPGIGLEVTLLGGVDGGSGCVGRLAGEGFAEAAAGTGLFFSGGWLLGTLAFGIPAAGSGWRSSAGVGGAGCTVSFFFGERQAASRPQQTSANPNRLQREAAVMRFQGKRFWTAAMTDEPADAS